MYNEYEVVNMEKMYQKSIQMIKTLDIKSEKEYNKLHKKYLLLSSQSLKYITNIKNFNKIIELANKI